MHEAIDDLMAQRRVDPGGLGRVMSASMAIHVTAVVLLFVVPKEWFHKEPVKPLLMTISLGGSSDSKSGGMVAAGARPIEAVAPTPKRPEIIPPASPPKSSALVVPVKPVPKTATTPVTTPAPTAVNRPPTTGAETRPGTAIAETGSKSQSTGLTFGGTGAGDTQIRLDTTFCCPEYIAELQRRILATWKSVQSETGTTIMVFEIQKDGRIAKLEKEQSSGSLMLDLEAKRAIEDSKFQPLPPEYPFSTLRIHLKFPYVR